MRSSLYPKLAVTNIRSNAKTYVPYLLASAGTIMMFFMMCSIAYNSALTKMPGSDSLMSMMMVGTVVIGIFSVIILFYINSFLIKQRKKEIGLYSVLGMEKGHIGALIAWETLFVAGISLVIGLLTGILMNKLAFLLLLKLMHFPVQFGFEISPTSLALTTALFLGIFALTLLSNLVRVRLSNPIELIRGGQVGEKEPKTKIITALFGLMCLAVGYYIAITTESPLSALPMFFVAVMLVIVGTYCLFSAGSIALLKMLRNNQRFYYQTKHFTAISGMIYRMKQNAVGLASICILSTAVLLTISITLSLYAGFEDALRYRFPKNVSVKLSNASQAAAEQVDAIIAAETQKMGIIPQDLERFRIAMLLAARDGTTFTASQDKYANMTQVACIPAAEYKRTEGDSGSSAQLASDQVLLIDPQKAIVGDTLTMNGQIYHIVERIIPNNIDLGINPFGSIIGIVVADEPTAMALAKTYAWQQPTDLTYSAGFDVGDEVTHEQQLKLTAALKKQIQELDKSADVEGVAEGRDGFLAIYGGLFFLGIFLGLLFLMATTLIIYYKQVTEGYDDRGRYVIMRKVGMSSDEVKQSIRSQVLIVFFLPLGMAAIHIIAAFKLITRLLILFNLQNVPLFIQCSLAVFGAFALLYSIVYLLTARTYYSIVSRQ